MLCQGEVIEGPALGTPPRAPEPVKLPEPAPRPEPEAGNAWWPAR